MSLTDTDEEPLREVIEKQTLRQFIREEFNKVLQALTKRDAEQAEAYRRLEQAIRELDRKLG
jgi:hypothetical protein